MFSTSSICLLKYYVASFILLFWLQIRSCHAQDQNPSYKAWLYFDNTISLTKHWTFQSDIHLRTSHQFSELSNVLLRGWLDYKLSQSVTTGVGYAYLGSWDDDVASPNNYYTEHRFFGQVQHQIDLPQSSEIRQRVRLEQRFFDAMLLPSSSVRSRYSLSWKQSINRKYLPFHYFFLENEVFANLYGRSLAGGKVFEQNRLYAGLGLPLWKSSEVELGSYYEIQHDVFKQRNQTIIFQLRLKTEW